MLATRHRVRICFSFMCTDLRIDGDCLPV